MYGRKGPIGRPDQSPRPGGTAASLVARRSSNRRRVAYSRLATPRSLRLSHPMMKPASQSGRSHPRFLVWPLGLGIVALLLLAKVNHRVRHQPNPIQNAPGALVPKSGCANPTRNQQRSYGDRSSFNIPEVAVIEFACEIVTIGIAPRVERSESLCRSIAKSGSVQHFHLDVSPPSRCGQHRHARQ